MNATTIPVSIAEEAARRVARLGAQYHLETMLDWTRGNVPNLKAIFVVPRISDLDVHANTVYIDAYCTWEGEETRSVPIEWDWANWKVQAIPLEVCRHFVMSCTSRPVPPPEAGTISL